MADAITGLADAALAHVVRYLMFAIGRREAALANTIDVELGK